MLIWGIWGKNKLKREVFLIRKWMGGENLKGYAFYWQSKR